MSNRDLDSGLCRDFAFPLLHKNKIEFTVKKGVVFTCKDAQTFRVI